MLINCGVKEIHCLEGYADELSLTLIEEAGVILHREDLP
jgi:deoxycytidylate deaminase